MILFKKNGPIPASFSVYFRLFNMLQFKLKKSVDGVLGIRTRGGKMEGANESTELEWHPEIMILNLVVGMQNCTNYATHNYTYTGLVVMGDELYSRGCGFEYQRRILDGHDIFSHRFVVKIVLFV